MTQEIKKDIEFLLRGTTEAPAVGNLAENLWIPGYKPSSKITYKRSTDSDDEEQKKAQASATKVNFYKEMKVEETSILRKIQAVVGYQALKKSKTSKSGSAAKKSGAKSNKKKSAAVNSELQALALRQVIISEPQIEPIFRYVPDRDTIQRLLIRCSNMKDDLGEFELYDEDGAKGEADADLDPEMDTISPENDTPQP